MSDIKALQNIVGSENVSDQPDDLEVYAQDHSFAGRVRPQAVVKPASVSQIQELVALAKKEYIPLVPVSSGAPHFKGDTVPTAGGAVIVDLTAMDRIVRIDKPNRTAMVEPGVTFKQLIPALEKEGLRLNLPLLPRASKSVTGSLLEREPVMLPKYHWDIADPMACCEIVYGTGDVFRTGNAAGPGTIEEQWEAGNGQNEAAGPLQADFYRFIQGAQGTMGIVSWITVRCERIPAVEEPYFVASDNLESLIDLSHWIIRKRLVDKCMILNAVNLAHIMGADPQKVNGLPRWTLFYSTAGIEFFPEERVQYQQLEIEKTTKMLGLNFQKAFGPFSAYDLRQKLDSVSEEPYWKMQPKGDCHDFFFLSTANDVPTILPKMDDLMARKGLSANQMGVYIQPTVQGCAYHCEFNMFFDPDNKEEKNKVQQVSLEAVSKLASDGAYFSRPYGPWSEPVFRRDAQTTIGLRKLKGIFDPANIMNPGKLCFTA